MQAIRENEKKLKILMLESSLNWGGQEDRLLREACWLRDRGHKVMLACNGHASIIGRAGAAGIEARSIPFRSNIDVGGIGALAKLVREEKPDLLHAHSSKDAWFSFWFHLCGVPVVRSRHMTLPASMPRGRRFIYKHGCRRLIAAAGFIADTMRDSLDVPSDRVDVIGECVDTEEFRPGDGAEFRREFGIAREAPLFGIVAMLRGEKGHEIFLAAARQVLDRRADARFAIVGSAASGKGLANLLRQTIARDFGGFPHPPVVMTGFRRDIPRVMRAFDALVVPSRQDAQTLVIPQAFATGKTVIGSNVGGIPELVRHGENGLLVPPENPEALAEAMLELAENPDKAASLGRTARNFATRELAVDRKMELLLGSYRRCVAGK